MRGIVLRILGKINNCVRDQRPLDSAASNEALGRVGLAAYELRSNMGDRKMRMVAQDREFLRKLRVDGTDDPEALRHVRGIRRVIRKCSSRRLRVLGSIQSP